MKSLKRTGIILGSLTLTSLLAAAQTPQAKPSFEVVSIKPAPPGAMMRGGGSRGDRLVLSSASLKMLLNLAYRRSGDPTGNPMEILGGPDWMDSALYDVQAKADCSGGAVSREQMMLMVQSMLEDRFQLKAHVETRDLPVYNLVVKDASKLKASADQTAPPVVAASQPCGAAPATTAAALPPPPAPGKPLDVSQLPRGMVVMMMDPSAMTLAATSTPISQVAGLLRQFAGRDVIDKTGLQGLFDITLKFSADGLSLPIRVTQSPPVAGLRGAASATPGGAFTGPPPAAPVAAEPVPSLFYAIQELGLRLEQGRGPLEVLVIDSVQKPSEN